MSDKRIIAVTGGRDFNDSRTVYYTLDRLKARDKIDLLVMGDATGADALAASWAEQEGVPYKVFRADWERHGRRAGPVRNAEMVAVGLSGLVAFPGGRGTADMTRQCRAAGVPVWEVPRG